MVKKWKLALIHTSPVLIPMFTELALELLPGIEVTHLADDSLIKEAMAKGSLSPAIATRLQDHIGQAQLAGAQAIMVTCSSMGPAIEAARARTQVPLLRVDQAMAEQAVELGRKLGVIATVATTLGPTADLIERCALAAGREVEVQTCLCDGALEKLFAGDLAAHDAMVKDQLGRLMQQVDVIVLAQASMARVITQLEPSSFPIPVLSSPRLAIQSLARELNASKHA